MDEKGFVFVFTPPGPVIEQWIIIGFHLPHPGPGRARHHETHVIVGGALDPDKYPWGIKMKALL
jgi:hypothetical protein